MIKLGLGLLAGLGVFLFLIQAIYSFSSSFPYDGIAIPIDPRNDAHLIAVREAVVLIVAKMDDHICLACPDVGIGLQCIVWSDGPVWRNPVVISRSDETSEGYETTLFDSTEAPRLVRRPDRVVVEHDGTAIDTVFGARAHCLAHALDLFDGTFASVPL